MNPDNIPADPIDGEIERDVAELRRLLHGVRGPAEPHPAYFQNFVVHVRDRIDRDRRRHRSWARLRRFAAIGTATAVLVVVATTVFQHGVDIPSGGEDDRTGSVPTRRPTGSGSTARYEPLFRDEGSSIILSKKDVRMLDAIMSEDDNELFMAIASNDQY